MCVWCGQEETWRDHARITILTSVSREWSVGTHVCGVCQSWSEWWWRVYCFRGPMFFHKSFKSFILHHIFDLHFIMRAVVSIHHSVWTHLRWSRKIGKLVINCLRFSCFHDNRQIDLLAWLIIMWIHSCFVFIQHLNHCVCSWGSFLILRNFVTTV